jgi:hypothetical protein
VNERLLAARQKEGGKNASLASNSMTSQQVWYSLVWPCCLKMLIQFGWVLM